MLGNCLHICRRCSADETACRESDSNRSKKTVSLGSRLNMGGPELLALCKDCVSAGFSRHPGAASAAVVPTRLEADRGGGYGLRRRAGTPMLGPRSLGVVGGSPA